MDVMVDAHGGYKIDGFIGKRQFHEGRLLMHSERRIGGQHPGRRIAPNRPREVAARKFQQLTSAAADIQPPLRAQSHAGPLQEPLHQKPFPAVEMEGILGESIPEWIIEQLDIRRRVLIELGGSLLSS
jgi:hypothetical protein